MVTMKYNCRKLRSRPLNKNFPDSFIYSAGQLVRAVN